jgi:hypothetical protein
MSSLEAYKISIVLEEVSYKHKIIKLNTLFPVVCAKAYVPRSTQVEYGRRNVRATE